MKEDRSNYVFQSNGNGEFNDPEHSLSPIMVDKFFPNVLSDVCNKVVLMSGTLVNRKNLEKNLGINKFTISEISIPSKFDKKNRPVYFCNTAPLNKNNSNPNSKEYKYIIETIMALLKYHFEKNESGVIFVPSYYLASNIIDSITTYVNSNGITLYSNSNSKESSDILKKFSDTKIKKRLLVSPSFEEGVNFTDDISRFQIIVKTPYLSLGDERTRVKMNLDHNWYDSVSFTRIIQSSARSVRNENDYAITYVLDSHASRLYHRIKKYCPNWFNEAVVED